MVTAQVTFLGTGKHQVEIKTWNTKNRFTNQQIDLTDNHTRNILVELKISDTEKPCVAVIIANDNPDLRYEIIGSLVKSDWLSKNN